MRGNGDAFDVSSYARVPEQATPAQAALLPGLNTSYKAAGTAENHETSRLVVILGKQGFRIGETAYVVFQYAHLGTGDLGFTAEGHVFRFPFFDLQPRLLTVHGRSLLRTFDYIALRRMPWIRQADRDFQAGDDEPVITRITVEDWKPPAEGPKHVRELQQA